MSEEHIEEAATAPANGSVAEAAELIEEFDAELAEDDIGFGTPEVHQIAIGDTLVDPTVQRRLDNSRVNDMIARFKRQAVGVVTLNRRKDGRYYVVDGQHRREAMVRRGEADELVTSNVYNGLTRQQEAVLFELLNTTKRPSPVDIFKARVVAGHRPTRHMYDMLTKRGWTITLQPGEYRFAAVRTLENLYRLDPEITERVLDVVTKSWQGRKDSADFRLLSGLGHFLMRYKEQARDSVLVDKLSKYPGGPAAIVTAGKTFRTTMRNKAKDAIAFVISNEYNKGERQENRVPQWDTRPE